MRTVAPPAWSTATRVGLRFCFVYILLFCLMTQIYGSFFPIPELEIPDLSAHWPVRDVVLWTAAHVFRIANPLSTVQTGSGDRTFDWVLVFCMLIASLVAAVIWSALGRKRAQYGRLSAWLRFIVRLALASQMFSYGIDKVIPLQMPFPYLTKLLEPFGNYSPMGILWFSVGASPAYETFAGSAEVLAALLLLIPGTTTLGALVCLIDMIQIFMLNMTYDVPVKLFSFHLLLLAVFLLLPDLRRLRDFFILNRPADSSHEFPLFRRAIVDRVFRFVPLLFGVWVAVLCIYGAYLNWFAFGGGRQKSPFYGIWNVDKMSVDGQTRSPLLNDYGRWRRVVFELPVTMTFQRMDDTFSGFVAAIDAPQKKITLSKRNDNKWKAAFTYARPSHDHLLLDGNMDGHTVHMDLSLMDRNKFLLVSRGFHWVQDVPFNR
jgi:uncharacterized membrane protein YphA (DoxX/SURF4 family)